MFGLLKPAPHKEQIKNSSVVRKKYRYWQFRNMYGMYLGYVLFYFTRKNITVVLPGLMAEFGYSMAELGWMLTLSSLMYGVSKFTSGILSDRSNPRYFMAFGLMITGCLNLVFGFSSLIVWLGVIWALNGWFQGWGWPPSSRLLMHWYGRKQRARWWAVWNTSHNLGGALIPIIATYAIAYFGGWRYALYVPGVMAILGGFFLMNRLRDTPQSLGLPSIEEYSGEASHAEAEKERELSTKEILFKHVLSNRYLWMLAFAYFFVYIIRQAVNDWSIVYLTTTQGFGLVLASSYIFAFEAGGFLGSLSAGWLSDLGFGGRRGPVNVLFSLGVVFGLVCFWATSGGMVILSLVSMFLIGFFIFGPQMMVGIAAAELSHKKAAATATGFAGIFGYVGAALSGGPLAYLTDLWGWGAFFIAVGGCAVALVLILLPLWSITKHEEVAPEVSAKAA